MEIHQNTFRTSLQYIGVKNFNDSFGTYKHHTDSFIAKEIFELSVNKPFEQLILDTFEEHLYTQINQNKIREINGARQLIKHIETNTDFGICYATGSLLKPAKLKLEKTGILFAPIQLVASNKINAREAIIKKAINNSLSFYNVEKFDRIISFGDGIWDLKAAENLSIEFVGIGDKHHEILTLNGMKKHYTDFSILKWTEL